jgi:hypothetical protein
VGGPRGPLGPSKGKRGSSRPVMKIFVFLFLKMLNSNSFCLFHCKLFRAPTMMKFFV